MEGKIYEEVIFNEQWSSIYDKLEKEGHEIIRGFFLPIQIKSMIEADLWTCYHYETRYNEEKNEKLITYLDDLIENGSAFDDLYVEYVTKMQVDYKKNSWSSCEPDDFRERTVIFFVRHNITIDGNNKVIFKHPLRFNEIKDYHDLMRCFPVNWDGLCEIMNKCYDYDFNRYRNLMSLEEQKFILDNYKNSSFMVYWYWTDLWKTKEDNGNRREKEVRMIEVLNQRSCRPMSKSDVYKYLDKRIE